MKSREKILIILLIFLLFGIFLYEGYQFWVAPKEVVVKEGVSEEMVLKEKVEEKTPEQLPQVYLSSEKLEQGDTLLIQITSKTPPDEVEGEFDSLKIHFFKPETMENLVGIVGIDVKKEPGNYDLVINFPNNTQFKKELNIIARRFPATEFLVTEELKEKGFTPSKIIENIISKENLIIQEIFSSYTPEAYFSKIFFNPLKEMKVTGDFGNIRKSGGLGIQHLGVDLEADIGTPVYTINDGLVRFSEELNTYGKTLMIDHGLGIFSLYLHLNKFNVLSGKQVDRGEVIGFSGNTGFSITPHLHFSVKIMGENIDPLRFIETIEKEMKLQ